MIIGIILFSFLYWNFEAINNIKQGSTSRKIRGIIPFDAQNHVKCAF
jgi:hypothetical protein